MMPALPACTLTGADVLTPEGFVRQPVRLAHGQIAAVSGDSDVTVDLSGHLVLPGIVDAWSEAGEAGPDEAAAAGITTRVAALAWTWETGAPGPAAVATRLAAAARRRTAAAGVGPEDGGPGPDRRVALRIETHTTGTTDRLLALLLRHGADLVLFSDRLPETLDRLRTDLSPGAASAWLRAEAAMEGAGGVPRHLCRLAAALDTLDIPYGSLGDRDAGAREYFRLIGARLCVCPQRASAARAARASGDAVLLPAYAVGGAGPVADMVAAGLATGLVSGTAPAASLLSAALTLADETGLHAAWALVSDGPAQALGLTDRGRIAAGLRADLCLIDAATGRVAGTLVAGRLVHATPALRARLARAGGTAPMAAE
jgi:alpha-D-ribose 1-methylphosphonate 5-triphosphate diphosphatase